MNFVRDGLSVNETKVSAFILAFIATIGFALHQFYTVGYIDGSMLTLIAYEIGAITGINIVNSIKGNSNIGG